MRGSDGGQLGRLSRSVKRWSRDQRDFEQLGLFLASILRCRSFDAVNQAFRDSWDRPRPATLSGYSGRNYYYIPTNRLRTRVSLFLYAKLINSITIPTVYVIISKPTLSVDARKKAGA